MQEQKYSARDEERLMEDIWSPTVAESPLNFVMYAYPWGQKGTPLEHFHGPRTWQREKLKQLGEHIKSNGGRIDPEVFRDSTSSGRGIGKSALVSWLTHWMLSTRIGSSVIISANSESQLRSVTWAELTKWTAMAINSHWWEVSATKLVPAKWLSEAVEKQMGKGTRYWAADGKLWSEENPDGYAGPHNFDGMMVVFDEASGIPDAIWPVAAGYFTEPIKDRYWFAFSNPRRNQGYFFETFHSKRDYWRNSQIDSRTVEGTDPSVYQQIIDEHGEDSYQARVEVKGQFPATGDDQFIGHELVEMALKRSRYNDVSAPTVIGVDVARFGGDKTCIVVRKGRDLVSVQKYQGLDTMNVVGKVIQAMDEWEPDLTVIDEGGLGAGVIDRLTEQRYRVRGVNFGSKADSIVYANKRAEMWGGLRDWLKIASIGSDAADAKKDNRDILQDLTGPTYKVNSIGSILLESKQDMKKRGLHSPDVADAIALTFAFPVSNRDNLSKRSMKDRMVKRFRATSMGIGSWMN